MNIDLSVKEYFEQLQLMETQYGMEEDLYPWIYMLLCMVDNKKQKLLGESYGGISIRDVHNAVSGYKGITVPSRREIKKFMQAQAFPEFVIFDKDITQKNKCDCYGCVEIKSLGDKELDINNNVEFIIEAPTEFEYEIRFVKNDSGEVEHCCYKIKQEQYNELKDNNYKFLVKSVDEQKKKIVVTCSEKEIDIVEKKQWRGRYSERTYVREIPIWSSIKLFHRDIVGEMVSHIKSYKKVLYTNGLQFCYIKCLDDTLNNNQINFTVTEIANLNNYYIAYKEKKIVENNAILEWEKLKLGLMSIEWHKKPIEITIPNL